MTAMSLTCGSTSSSHILPYDPSLPAKNAAEALASPPSVLAEVSQRLREVSGPRAATRAGRGARRLANQLVVKAQPRQGPGRDLWVFGGSSGRSYADNSAALHRCAAETVSEVVWLLDRDSVDWRRASDVGEVVDRQSLVAARLVQSASVAIFSHGIHDLPGVLESNAVVVRLGHGLTAFKRGSPSTDRRVIRTVQRVDLAPVASEFERLNKQEWGFSAGQLPITGLARFDPLKRLADTAPLRDTLVWCPTVRERALGRASERRTVERELGRVWELLINLAHDACLEPLLFLHPGIRHLGPAIIRGKPTNLVTASELPAALVRARLMVSDYSSIAWDSLYVDTPVVFYRPDLDLQHEARGSHVNLRLDMFGPIAQDPESLKSAITHELSDPTFWDSQRSSWGDRAFAFRDDSNCERVVTVVLNELEAQRVKRTS